LELALAVDHFVEIVDQVVQVDSRMEEMVQEGNHALALEEDTNPVVHHKAWEEMEVQVGHHDHPNQPVDQGRMVGDIEDGVRREERQMV
jgi:hypothetical protein